MYIFDVQLKSYIMKKMFFIAIAFVLLSGCKKETIAEADFSFYQSSTAGKVNFTDLSKNANSYFWDFGDYSTSNERNPEHVYAANGNYTVKLTVNGDKSTSKAVEVTSVAPVATTGRCVFWMATASYGNVKIFINGAQVGTMTSYMTNGAPPPCGSNGFVTIERPTGIYNFTAESEDGNFTWSGTFSVTNGTCSSKQLS